MRNLTTAACILCALLGAALSVLPGDARSKHADNFFSPPTAQGQESPKFKDRPQPQNSSGMVSADGEMPRQDMITSIPSLTEAQRKAIRELFVESRKQTQPLNDQIGVIEKQVKAAAATKEKISAPKAVASTPSASSTPATPSASSTPATPSTSSTPVTPPTPSPSATPSAPPSETAQLSVDVLNAELSGLKQAVKDKANKLSQQINGVLTSDQMSELEAMRKGTLIIGSGAESMRSGGGEPSKQKN